MYNRNTVIILPGYIYRSLIRNKFNIVEFTDYAKLRKVLTIEDLACLVNANQNFKIERSYVGYFNYLELFNSMTSEQNSEFSRSVLPLASTENIATMIKNNLRGYDANDAESLSEHGLYSFIMTEDHIFCILNEGFEIKLSDKNFKAKFIKEYISKLYAKMPIHEVSYSPMFSEYMKGLNALTVQ